jgi:TolB-like protein
VLIAAGVAAVAAGAAGYGWFRQRPKRDPLVAVLPFDSLSPDPQMGYFADGLSEDILNALIRGGGVRVTSRTSSFTFRGVTKAKAASALKADYLLDGSVLREGGRLRVNAHLADVAKQQTLWSQTYDRDVGQGLQIEDEIAGKVAAALKVQFASAGSPARGIDPVAYDLYLRGRDATRVHTPESLRQGNELLRSAVALAPRFSAAWYALAKNYWRSGFLEPIPEQQRGFELGRQAAQRAIALDPRNAAAFGVITQMTPTYGHWREIDLGLTQGLNIAPNDPDLLLWRSVFLLETGRLKAGAQWARRAQALDPFELAANHRLCQALYTAGQFADAEAVAARIAAIWPDQLAGYWDRFWTFIAAGRDADAAAVLADVRHRPPGEGEEFEVLSQAIRTPRNAPPAARAAAGQSLLALGRQGMGYASNSVIMLARIGQFDEALELVRSLYLQKGSIAVERSIEFRGNSRFPLHGEAEALYLFHPFLAPLRRAGKLKEIFDGIGLSEYWRTASGPDA